MKGKAAAEDQSSKVQRSGYGSNRGSGQELTQKALAEGKAAGHKFAENPSKDGGVPGQSAVSHAEMVAAMANPGKPLAVDDFMCPDCFAFFQRLAVARGQTLVVNEPGTQWVFRAGGARVGVKPGSAVILRPDGTASSGRLQ